MSNEKGSKTLPPKTCTIDRLITVPNDIKNVLAGKKIATRRNGRYADIGEIMNLKDHKFVIKNVYSQKLGEMTDENAKQEGFQNLEEYKNSILSLHPGMKWAPSLVVWVHEFKPLQI